jgi:hypothetical protein
MDKIIVGFFTNVDAIGLAGLIFAIYVYFRSAKKEREDKKEKIKARISTSMNIRYKYPMINVTITNASNNVIRVKKVEIVFQPCEIKKENMEGVEVISMQQCIPFTPYDKTINLEPWQETEYKVFSEHCRAFAQDLDTSIISVCVRTTKNSFIIQGHERTYSLLKDCLKCIKEIDNELDQKQ